MLSGFQTAHRLPALKPEWKFAARDEDRRVWVFTECQEVMGMIWADTDEGDVVCLSDLLVDVTSGTCDWKDSLVMRPGYEGE